MATSADEGAQILAAHAAAVRARLDRIRAQQDDIARLRDGASGDDEHDPEGETLATRWSQLRALELAAEAEERSVAAAQADAARGAYGVCIGCGGRIPAARLRALPHTRRCVVCAERDGPR